MTRISWSGETFFGVFSRVSAPAATNYLAGVVVALLSSQKRPAPRDLLGPVGDQLPGGEDPVAKWGDRLVTGPMGLGTSAARSPWGYTAAGETVTANGRGVPPPMLDGPTGLGTSALRVSAAQAGGVNQRVKTTCGQWYHDG